jgi:hypothetical protein
MLLLVWYAIACYTITVTNYRFTWCGVVMFNTVKWAGVGQSVSGYGLDDRVIQVWSLAEAKNFSSKLWAQTSSGAYPASCPMGIGGPFPGDKALPVRDADHSPPSGAEVVSE